VDIEFLEMHPNNGTTCLTYRDFWPLWALPEGLCKKDISRLAFLLSHSSRHSLQNKFQSEKKSLYYTIYCEQHTRTLKTLLLCLLEQKLHLSFRQSSTILLGLLSHLIEHFSAFS
jgi:hypothetical protein